MENLQPFAPNPKPPQAGPAGCPQVADLILYALGQASPDDRRRVEAHLSDSHCRDCRRWVDSAARLKAEAWDEAQTPTPTGKDEGPSRAAQAAGFSSPRPRGKSMADDVHWQQVAFRDLERRLQQLDDPRPRA